MTMGAKKTCSDPEEMEEEENKLKRKMLLWKSGTERKDVPRVWTGVVPVSRVAGKLEPMPFINFDPPDHVVKLA